jgi:hypothetical protein
MFVKRQLTMIPVLVFLGGCADRNPPPAPDSGPPDGPVLFETIEIGGETGFTKGESAHAPGVVYISDEGSWSSFWEQHTRGRASVPDRPSVDFSSQAVVGVVDSQPNQVTVEIDELYSEAGVLTVRASCLCTPWTAPSWPFHLVVTGAGSWESVVLDRTDIDGGAPCSD